MCYYEYNYYSQCAHQEFCCVGFCAHASSISGELRGKEAPSLAEGATDGSKNHHHNTRISAPTDGLSSHINSATAPSTAPQRGSVRPIHRNPSFAQHSQPFGNSTHHLLSVSGLPPQPIQPPGTSEVARLPVNTQPSIGISTSIMSSRVS